MKKFMKKLAKKTEGFTLVELIVVIAILGILAGIAVPAYSGYLNKANKAADQQVISYANTIVQSGAAYVGKTASAVVDTTTSGKTPAVDTNGNFTIYVTDDNAYAAMKDFAPTGNGVTYSDTNKTVTFAGLKVAVTSDLASDTPGQWALD